VIIFSNWIRYVLCTIIRISKHRPEDNFGSSRSNIEMTSYQADYRADQRAVEHNEVPNRPFDACRGYGWLPCVPFRLITSGITYRLIANGVYSNLRFLSSRLMSMKIGYNIGRFGSLLSSILWQLHSSNSIMLLTEAHSLSSMLLPYKAYGQLQV
jgi:hypothetical protein